jgi:hypothetical protein
MRACALTHWRLLPLRFCAGTTGEGTNEDVCGRGRLWHR